MGEVTLLGRGESRDNGEAGMVRSVKGYSKNGAGGPWGSVGCARDLEISSKYAGFGTGGTWLELCCR